MEDQNIEDFELRDETVNSIIMHRDTHFSGSFDVMIEYYEKEGKGASDEFSLEKIRDVQLIEKKMGQNIAGVLLSGAEAEEVQKAKEMYKRLRDLYDHEDEASRLSRLIADLILSESDAAANEIEAIVAEKGKIVPALIELITHEDFYKTLYPGYGMAPQYAMECLEKIGDKRSVMSLFECIGRRDVLDEERAIQALRIIGDPAKEFLVNVLKSKPITEDNERAAVALIHFTQDDPEISKLFLDMLKSEEIRNNVPLAAQLILGCEGLVSEKDRNEFTKLLAKGNAPSILDSDVSWVVNSWK